MKIEEYRKYDLHLVELTNLKKNAKTLIKGLGLKEPVFGIMYIDYMCGISLKIVGDKSHTIVDKAIIFRADGFEFDIKLAENKTYDRAIAEIKKDYYTNELTKLRKDKKLDEFRHEHFPDDVLCVLLSDASYYEKIWVRLMIKTNEKDLYVGRLLNTSFNDKDYSCGQKVAIRYYNLKEGNYLIIEGLVRFDDE